MKKSFSGIQPSGMPHLGNYLGAIKQQIELQNSCESILFIADLHAITTVREPEKMRAQTLEIALTYLALGLDPNKTIFFKQSDVSEHSELCWIFDCITPIGFLQRAHAWKDAEEKGKKETTAGLFNYPVLQAADILLYEPDLVPVGQDQKQHIEMCRDIAEKFNHTFGNTFKLPEPLIKEEVAIVPGTDGQKMSKSYKNTIDIFAEEKTLTKQIMSIVTDSLPVEAEKDPEKCNVFKIYKLLATNEEANALSKKYLQGGLGYGEAKKILAEKVLSTFAQSREKYQELKSNPQAISAILKSGAEKAKKIAANKLQEVKEKIGLNF